MFSGIIRHKAEVLTSGEKLALEAPDFLSEEKVSLGDSICISGTCLTVVRFNERAMEFDVVSETLRCTKLGTLRPGQKVNIERSMKVGDKVDGHFVLGHVDFVSMLVSKTKDASNTWKFTFDMPESARPFICPKGSVCIDGISLTVGEVDEKSFCVYIIPHTYQETTLSELTEGGSVNIEYDCFSRYVVNAIRNTRQ